MTVLDASAIVDLLLDLQPWGDEVARILRKEAGRLAAPHLLDVEVCQVLRRWILTGKLTPARGQGALDVLAGLAITRYPHSPLLSRALELRDNATVYDAMYLALAEALRGTLVTRDAALARVPGLRARVRILA